MYYFGCLHLSMPLLVACKVASAGCFATDKLPFISKKSPEAISGYIIGVLNVQRFKICLIYCTQCYPS